MTVIQKYTRENRDNWKTVAVSLRHASSNNNIPILSVFFTPIGEVFQHLCNLKHFGSAIEVRDTSVFKTKHMQMYLAKVRLEAPITVIW